MNSQQSTGQTRWERAFNWFDSLWGWPDSSDPQQDPPRGSRGRTSAALNRQAQPPKPRQVDNPKDEDTRPMPEPQNLDALTAPPPPAPASFRRPPPMTQIKAWEGSDPRWCSCQGAAHDARCRFANGRNLDVKHHFSPPPGSAPAEPTNTH